MRQGHPALLLLGLPARHQAHHQAHRPGRRHPVHHLQALTSLGRKLGLRVRQGATGCDRVRWRRQLKSRAESRPHEPGLEMSGANCKSQEGRIRFRALQGAPAFCEKASKSEIELLLLFSTFGSGRASFSESRCGFSVPLVGAPRPLCSTKAGSSVRTYRA